MAGLKVHRNAFTLIELLVVIAIIALLVSILLPSLNAAKDAAKRATCLMNMRRLGIASSFYVDQYGVFAPVRLKNNGDGSAHVNAYGRTNPRWQWFLDQGVGPVIDPRPYGGVFGDAQTTTMTNDYFMCPAFAGVYERDIRNGPYGYNYQYLGDTRSFVNGRYTNWPVNESTIRRPASMVLIGDSRGGDPGHGQHSYTLDPPKLAASKGVTTFGPTAGKDGAIGHSPVEARHRDQGCVVFVDGHASASTLSDLGYRQDSSGVVIAGSGDNSMWSDTGFDEQ